MQLIERRKAASTRKASFVGPCVSDLVRSVAGIERPLHVPLCEPSCEAVPTEAVIVTMSMPKSEKVPVMASWMQLTSVR